MRSRRESPALRETKERKITRCFGRNSARHFTSFTPRLTCRTCRPRSASRPSFQIVAPFQFRFRPDDDTEENAEIAARSGTISWDRELPRPELTWVPRRSAQTTHTSSSLWFVEKRPTSPPRSNETSRPPYSRETHPPFFAGIVRSESDSAVEDRWDFETTPGRLITWIYEFRRRMERRDLDVGERVRRARENTLKRVSSTAEESDCSLRFSSFEWHRRVCLGWHKCLVRCDWRSALLCYQSSSWQIFWFIWRVAVLSGCEINLLYICGYINMWNMGNK